MFRIGEEEIVLEVSVEKDVIIGIMVGEDVGWRGTLEGLKKTLTGEIDVK
ncbi:hypothetical protein ACFL2S_06190 [Thermodesulfobacteriota bacterium]